MEKLIDYLLYLGFMLISIGVFMLFFKRFLPIFGVEDITNALCFELSGLMVIGMTLCHLAIVCLNHFNKD